MRIDDAPPGAGQPGSEESTRGDYARQQFGDPNTGILKSLSDRFVVRTFRFSSAPARLASAGDLKFEGAQTKLGAALDGVRQELAGLPLAGVVLVSDGADTTDSALTDALLGMKAAALPVFTVGIGQDRLARDIQVDRVTTPRRALKGTSLLVDAVVRHTGYAGETVDARRRGRRPHRWIRRQSSCPPTASRLRCASASWPRMPARGCSSSASVRARTRSSR